MKLIRGTLICLGLIPIGIGLYGLWNYYTADQLVAIGKWLVIGLALHDGVLVPLVLVGGALIWQAHRVLPPAVGRIVAGGLVVAGVTSLLAAPAIIREGESDNPTLLTQHYGYNLAWALLIVAVVTIGGAVIAWLSSRKRRPVPPPVSGELSPRSQRHVADVNQRPLRREPAVRPGGLPPTEAGEPG